MDPEGLKNIGLNATALDDLPNHATIRETLQYISVINMAVNAPREDCFPSYNALSTIMGIVSALLVISRIIFKLCTGGYGASFGLDDLFLIATILVGAFNTINISQGVGSYGLGRHIWTLGATPESVKSFLEYFLALTIVYFALVMLIKLAALAFFLRIFPSQRARRQLKGTMAVVALYGLTFVLVGGLQCQPIDFYWTGWDGEHKGFCVHRDWVVWSNAAISIVLDIWIIYIPLHEIGGTTLELWKKFTGGLMLSFGLIMTFVSIVRLWYLVHFKADDVDPTWHYLDICLWSTVEINVGIWCLCVPTVRIMFLYGRKQYMKWKARSGQDGRSVHDKNSRAHNCASQSDSGTRGIRLQDMSTQPSWYSEHTENDAAMAVSPLQVGDASRV